MHGLVKIAILGPLVAALVSSLPAQNDYIPGVQFRRFACPPIRTLPDVDDGRSRASARLIQDFMREWCPPSAPITFPGEGHYSRWGSARPLTPRRPVNPYRGIAVEGGSIPIIFPGRDRPLNSNLEPSNDIGFINSKMHPWLLNRPRRDTEQWHRSSQSSRL